MFHKDIKPRNMFLDNGNNEKVDVFGLFFMLNKEMKMPIQMLIQHQL